MDNVCNRRLSSFPCKVEMAEEQEYLPVLFVLIIFTFSSFSEKLAVQLLL